jgi:hypothetical protein
VKEALDQGVNWYKHKCFFCDLAGCGVSSNVPGIPESTSFDILKHFMWLIGRRNISFRTAESTEMRELIRTAIQVGQCNPDVTAESLFPDINDGGIANAFHHVSDELSGELLEHFKLVKFVAIALDAGSIKRRSFLTILMANALLKRKPFVLRIIRNFPGTFESYAQAIDSAVEFIEGLQLVLVGIAADNLKVQTSVVSHLSKRSTLRKNSRLKGVRFFPCACHTFNLSFCDAQKSGGEVGNALKAMCERVQEASKILCSRPIATKLTGHCPSFCPTRWTNLSDICCFLLRDRLEILKVMESNMDRFTPESALTLIKAIYEDSPLFVALLAPYHDFVTQMESDSMSVGFVLPMLRTAVEQSFSYCASLNLGDQFPTLMRECVGRRFAGPPTGESQGRYGALYRLAELLTPSGRYAFRMNNLEKDSLTLASEELIPPLAPEAVPGYAKLLDWLISTREERNNEYRDIVAIISAHFGLEPIDIQLPDTEHALGSTKEPPSETSSSEYSESDDFADSIETDDEGFVEYNLRPSVRVTRQDYVKERVYTSDSEAEDFSHEEERPQEEKGDEMERTEAEEQGDHRRDEIEQNEEENGGGSLQIVTNVFDDLTMEHVKRELVLLARDLGIESTTAVEEVFGAWLSSSMPRSMILKMNGPILELWREAGIYPKLAPLAEIAQRLLAVPSSEASVERAIWHQRRILCPGSLRMSCATEEARCRFLVSTE